MITEQHFASIFTATMPNRVNLETFIEIAGYTGLHGIRWPGGTHAEVSFQGGDLRNNYQITNSNLMENRSGSGEQPAGILEMFEVSKELGIDLMIILPTLAYASSSKGGSLESPNLHAAYEEYYDFFERLVVKSAWGEVPENLTLEIGNEASLHFGDQQESYAKIANEFLRALDDVLKDFQVEKKFDVGIQMGISRDQSMNSRVISEIHDDYVYLIDSVRNHELNKNHGLSWDKGWAGLNDAAKQYYTEWVNKTNSDLKHYVSAWNTGIPAIRNPMGGIDAEDPANFDFGMKSVSAVVEMFANFDLLGVDKAAHWGVAISETHKNATSSVNQSGDIVQTVKAETIKLLSESIINTSIAHDITVDEGGSPIRSRQAYRYSEDGVLDPRSVRDFVFEDVAKYVIFSAANRFETSDNERVLQHEITLQDLVDGGVDISFAVSTHLTAEVQAFLFEDTLNQDVGIVQHGRPVWDNENIKIEFTQNYELVRIIAFKGDFMEQYNLPGESLPLGAVYTAGQDEFSLFGDDADNILIGSYSDEVLLGGAGADLIDGKAGFDFASYEFSFSSVVVDLISTSDNLGDARGDIFFNIEGLIGSSFDDRLSGDALPNSLSGASGNDVLFGRSGDDTLDGGSGMDQLFGEQGNDLVVGDEGNDQLYGGGGIDRLYGGGGSDVFVFSSGDGLDIIYDFEDGSDFVFFPEINFADFSQNAEVLDYFNNGVMIRMGDDRLFIRDLRVDEVDASDFIFLDTPPISGLDVFL